METIINTCFYDTNAILELQDKAFDKYFVISSISLQELESIKTSSKKDEETKYKARKILHLLDENKDKYDVVVYSTLMEKGDMTEERMKRICPAGNKSVLNALSKIGNAYDFLMNIYNEIKALTNSLIEYGLTAEGAVATGYEEETISLALGRWRKLQKDFYDKQNDTFDLSKVKID